MNILNMLLRFCQVAIHACSRKARPLADQIHQCLLIVARDDLSPCCPLKLLEALCAAEPRWMITGKPALRDAITPLRTSQYTLVGRGGVRGETYVLYDVTMITDEEEGTGILYVDLHANQACECQHSSRWV